MTEGGYFQKGGADYARRRPSYPPELAAALASLAPSRRHALDVGCGSGQLTAQLADHFEQVVGTDISKDQIAHAAERPNVSYRVEPAEQLGEAVGSVDLVVAAQAAHWFDLPRFYAEAARVARPGGVLALVVYGVMEIDGPPNDRFQEFYWNEIGPYWPAERRHVERGYADLPFPVEEMAAPPLAIERDWTFDDLMGYVATWSAMRQAEKLSATAIVDAAATDLEGLWGGAEQRWTVRWPISMRVGRLSMT